MNEQLIKSITELGKHYKTDLVNGLLEVETPYKNHHGDFITLYIEQSDDVLILTDDGQTINTLSLNGVDFEDSKKLNSIFKTLLKHYELEYERELEELKLIINFKKDNFIENLTCYIQGILAIDTIYFIQGK